MQGPQATQPAGQTQARWIGQEGRRKSRARGLGGAGVAKGSHRLSAAGEPGIQNAFSTHEIQDPEGPSYLWTFPAFWQAWRSAHAKQFSSPSVKRFSFVIFPKKPWGRNCRTDSSREQSRERKGGNHKPG